MNEYLSKEISQWRIGSVVYFTQLMSTKMLATQSPDVKRSQDMMQIKHWPCGYYIFGRDAIASSPLGSMFAVHWSKTYHQVSYVGFVIFFTEMCFLQL